MGQDGPLDAIEYYQPRQREREKHDLGTVFAKPQMLDKCGPVLEQFGQQMQEDIGDRDPAGRRELSATWSCLEKAQPS